MGTQQFCLKWNNHSSNMLNVFETLLTSEQLVDVTLACDGLSLKAHKMVLSACSPFFQSLFQENPCKHPIVILKDIRYTDLKAIIDFMYKGEVNVGQAHLSALLKTAETLKVKGLAEVSGEDGQSSSGSVVQQEVPVFPQAQHSSDVANIVQTIDNSIRPSSDSPTGRKRKRTKWKNRGQGNGNDSETDDQGPAAKNQEIVSADVIEDDSSSIGVVDGPSDTRNAKESRIIIEEATIVGDYVEPAALLEQNMTTDNVQPISSQLMLTNATSKDNEINVPDNRSYDSTVATLTPETVDLIDRPEDVKPTALVSYEEPPMSPNATSSHHSQDDSNSMTMYMDPNSMPAIAGPSNYQQDKQPSASAGQETPKATDDRDDGVTKPTTEKMDVVDDEEAYDSPYEDFYAGDEDDDDEEEEEDDDENNYEEYLVEDILKQPNIEVRPSSKEDKRATSRDEEEDTEELQNPESLKSDVEYSFCRFCNAPFSLNTSRVRHERTIHLAQSFHICSECGYKSTRTDRHRRHMKDCHDIDIPLLRHTRTTPRAPRPSQGSKSPSENNIYQCYVCEKTFRARRSVLRHFREKHNNPDTFTCSFCGKSYTRKENLTKHMDSVHNIIV